jgi:hypothetical protein
MPEQLSSGGGNSWSVGRQARTRIARLNLEDGAWERIQRVWKSDRWGAR